jgi:hypothetical protein
MQVYADFGFSDVTLKIALRPEKRVGSDADWDRSEAVLRAARKAVGSAGKEDIAELRNELQPLSEVASEMLEILIGFTRATSARLDELREANPPAAGGGDVRPERAEVAALDVEINHLRDVLTELRAGTVVSPPPTPEQIQAATRLLDPIVALAAEDAAVTAGLDLLQTALAAARDLSQNAPA